MRIRTIKPDFWAHPVMSKQSDSTKLLAIGLLNIADDEGYFFADARMIRNAIRPLDDDSRITTVSLRELSEIGYIEIKNHPTHGAIGFVPSFTIHQVINKSKPSKIKGLFTDGMNTVSIPYESGLEGKGKEGNKEGKGTRNKRVDDALPLPYDSPDFKLFWANWQQHRIEKKAKLTPTATKQQLERLAEMGEERAIAALKHSMSNGWQGIYEPGISPSNINYKTNGKTYAERHPQDTEAAEVDFIFSDEK